MGNNWFTADTHFNHQRTLDLSGRPFETVEEMNKKIVENWNNLVHPSDTVYHLGDFGDYSFRKRLNGRIVLLVGNYERNDFKMGLTPGALMSVYGFDEVWIEDCRGIEISDANGQIITLNVVHEPSHRNINYFTLFGHIHRAQMVKRNALNVGIDCHYYKPISFEKILFFKNAIQHHYDNEVFTD